VILILSVALLTSGTATSAMFSLSGVVYIGGLFGSLFFLRSGPDGRSWALFTLLVTWVTDVGAYRAAWLWGNTNSRPRLARGKSWEGAICALSRCPHRWGAVYGLGIRSGTGWPAALLGCDRGTGRPG
jgi:CDP-diglyceride synthetase